MIDGREYPRAVGRRRGVQRLQRLLRGPAPISLAAIVVGVVAAWTPSTAQACACCAEPGMRIEGAHAIDDYTRGELARLRFGARARLQLGAAEFETVRGIERPDADYAVAASVTQSAITLTFTAADGRSGTITVPLGARVHEFFVDTRGGDPDTETVLYKEWTLRARSKTTGIFAPASKAGRPRVRLIVHGSGNACTDAEQFAHWTLEVSGAGADFTLLGDLAPAAELATP